MDEEKKRKNRTSVAAVRRYNDKTYDVVRAYLPKELVEQFKAKCSELGVSQAQVVREAVEAFLNAHAE